MTKKRMKLLVIGLGVALIVFAAKSPWFKDMISNDQPACICVDDCPHDGSEDCGCDDNCGCPNCVPE